MSHIPPDFMRYPRRPEYNAATDGNPFEWILKASREVRVQEQATNDVNHLRVFTARRLAMPPLALRRGEPVQAE